MKTVKYIIPERAADFKCIGPECTYNCCDSVWQILVDKKTYQKYKALPQSDATAPIINSSLKRNRHSVSVYDYGYIQHVKRCPFLNDDNLCIMQIEHGEEYLSHTCNTYPRIEYSVSGTLHRGFSLTCEEVVRRCVLSKDSLNFIKIETKAPNLQITNIDVSKNGFVNQRRYFFEIREFIFAVLQFRKYSFSERLTILALFMKALDACEPDKVLNLIDQYLTLIGSGSFDGQLQTLQSIPKIPAEFIDAIFQMGKFTRLDEVIVERINGLESLVNSKREGLAEDDFSWYSDLVNEVSADLTEYEHIFENFIVMSMFNAYEQFINPKISFVEAFGQFAMYYMVLRLFLMVQIKENKVSEFDLIKLCIDVAHAFDVKQSKTLSKYAFKNLRELGLNNLGFYISLIKE